MLRNLSCRAVNSLLIELSLGLLILFSPLIYGSVPMLPLSIVESLAFIILLLVVSKLFFESEVCLFKAFILLLVALLFFIIFQIINLPENFLAFISPATISLYKDFRISHMGNSSLSIYPEMSVHLLLQLLACMAVFWGVLNYVDTEQKSKRIIAVIIIAGFFYSIYGIISKIYLPTAAFSTFANRNHFSAYAQMIVPLVIAFALIIRSRIKRVLLVFAAAVMILAIFYSWSRAGRICFVASMIIFFILFRIKKPIGKFGLTFLALSFFLVIFAGIIGLFPLLNRFDTLNSPLKAYGDRLTFITDTLTLIKDFPVFGTGFGTYAEIIQKYKTSAIQVSYVFSHNEPIQLLAEIGIVGFLLSAFFLFSSFIRIFVLWFKRKNDFAVFVTLACFVGLFSVSMHSFFDFVLHVPANSILFFIILGLAFRAASTSVNKSTGDEFCIKLVLPKSLRFIVIGLILVVLVLLESLIFSRCRAQLIFEGESKRAMNGLGVETILIYKKAIKNMDKAISLNPLNSLYQVKRADLIADLSAKDNLKTELGALDGFGSRQDMFLVAERFYKRAIDLNPTKADNHLRLGWLYRVLEESVLAQDEFQKALLLDPQNMAIKRYIDRLSKE
ncbi:MAG: O-antigen ligase family protein [Candidatus Omnitrophica bacterium]|nr:O-antigen ligase family protein [Candidatus Omnitrophota bacterium]